MIEKTENIGKINKKYSIKNRLQRYFLLISLSIIFLMSVFSLGYFYKNNLTESSNTIRNKMFLADLFLDEKMNDIAELSKNLAANRSIQVGIGLGSNVKIMEYLDSFEKENAYRILVFDENGIQLTEVANNFKGEQECLQSALKGEFVTQVTIVDSASIKSPAYISASPVFYGDDIIGVVIVEFIFSDNKDFFIELSRNLECELAVYSNAKSIVSVGELFIDEQLYKTISLSGNRFFEKINFSSSGLNVYKTIRNSTDSPIAVFHVHLSSYQYVKVFFTAILVYFTIATFFTVFVIFLVLRISKSILGPIDLLLRNVNIVRSGDLSHEVILQVQDEIGRLGSAFNDLRTQLNEKITTIQDMNQSLEATVQERTEALDNLNKKMKHYLSPQLYASIAGGERDVSVKKHYRKKLTVFFSDVVNFTSTTESLEAEDLSTLLNSYLDSMANIAQKYGGTIDKYVGDAVMVFFGDPEFTSDKDHAIRAVKMAMEMQMVLISFREQWRAKGVENPFHVRMGINTGYCTIGNFGSETKMDYTIIGNNVNMAARFEAAANPDSILMSPETYALVRDEIDCVLGGEFTLKGVSGTMKAYTPIKLKNSKTSLEFAKVTSTGELIFPDKPVNLKLLSKGEKRNLLLSLKNTFENIASSKSDLGKQKVKSLDEEEKAQKLDIN